MLNRLKSQGIGTIVVLLEPQICISFRISERYKDFEVVYYPIEDYGIPSTMESFDDLMDVMHLRLQGHGVFVHCFGGNGRSGMVIAGYAIKHRNMTAKRAIEWVRSFRPKAVETQEQEKFLERYAKVYSKK
jgi:protein-tyrosine phosphatase